jgi:thiamine-phosphate pyrophosphorylase
LGTISSALYLIADLAGDADGPLAALLTAALSGGPVQSVLLRPAEGQTLSARTVKPLVELIQSKGCAALIADDAALARTVRADGLHLTWSKEQIERFAEAREILGERFIVGVDAGRSRHDAMSLGEGGADYIAFGIPAHVEDRDTARDRQRDLVAWWSEIFEIPCVAFDVLDLENATELARTGADFIAIALPGDLSPADAPDWVAGAIKALTYEGAPA